MGYAGLLCTPSTLSNQHQQHELVIAMTKHPFHKALRVIFHDILKFPDLPDLYESPKPRAAPTEDDFVPAVPDQIRKGVVLRRAEYTRKASSPTDLLFEPGGPRVVLAVSLDDQHGKEIITVDQALAGEVALVVEGMPVKV